MCVLEDRFSFVFCVLFFFFGWTTRLWRVLGSDVDGHEKVTKTVGLISKTTTSHVHHTFLYISFPFLHDYDVKMPYFAFIEEVNKQQRNFISLSEFGSVVIWNSASGGFAYIWWSKWVGIIAIKTEKTQIHFLSDVLVAVASLNLKVPICT